MSSKKQDTRTKILSATWKLMEQRRGHGVSMGDIASEAGISRQALYLHFKSRTDLMNATVHYVDEIKGLQKRLKKLQAATTGTELLESCVEFWGNYMPEIYGLAKAFLNTLETDEATASAWNGCMTQLQVVCEQTIQALHHEKQLSPEWSVADASDMMWSMLSIYNWELLTKTRSWSTEKYIVETTRVLKSIFLIR